jgi:HSP20 family molecular chaperone IbpA
LNYNRFFRVLALAVVLAMLMIAIPVTPAVAAPVIALDIQKGQIGDKIIVEGSGFRATTPGYNEYTVDIYFSREYIEIGDDINYYDNIYEKVKQYVYTSDSGTISKAFYVPEILDDSRYSDTVHGGTYYVYVTYSGDEEIEAYAEFTVIGVTDFSPTEGPVGASVEVDGVGFDANDDIMVKFAGNKVNITGGDHRVKSNGSFTSQIEVPESIAGVHTVEFSDDSGHSDQFQFTVDPSITLSPTRASVGEEVTVSGTGFDGDTDIFVYFNGAQIYVTGDSDTNSFGSFESRFVVPEIEPGSYYVKVEDDSFNDADAELEVGAGLTISPVTTASSPGNIGDVVTVSGVGFKPDWEITITYTSEPVTFTTASLADGSFSYELIIPPSTSGEHLITASDGVSSKTAEFFVESTPPTAPLLVEPAADAKASAQAAFDWGEVTDDSLPISYELQVATNNQFTTESILVYKTGLTISNYTLTDDEKLESTDETAPYYWRVRAKDAASNASNWTSGSAFTVGASIQIKGWLLYVLIAVGAVAVFFLGVWIGRRSVPTEDYW